MANNQFGGYFDSIKLFIKKPTAKIAANLSIENEHDYIADDEYFERQ